MAEHLSAPHVTSRPGVVTVCRRLETDRAGLGEAIDAGMSTVARQLHGLGIEPLGPPCLRFLRLQMPVLLDVEVGVPVTPQDAARVTGPVRASTIPGGDYVEYEHVGGPASMAGAHALVRGWARDAGLPLLAETHGATWSGVVEEILTLAEDTERPERWRTRIAYLCAAR